MSRTKKMTAHLVLETDCPVHGHEMGIVASKEIEACECDDTEHEVLYEAAHDGPAQVSTPAYRSGWEATFGPRGQA